jgi:hypothetical protein
MGLVYNCHYCTKILSGLHIYHTALNTAVYDGELPAEYTGTVVEIKLRK